MNQAALRTHDYEWLDYYDQFPYFSIHSVRDRCHPRIMEHEGTTKKAIILVHGLTDSPYFMTAIADFFFGNLGYNVYLPLLHCHGLKEPNGMEGVKLNEWKKNVDFAVEVAALKADEVSIGGLSTGGTLSFYSAVNNDKITGALYLFSAALDLAGGPGGIFGELKEILLRTPLADILDRNKPLIGENPYRYSHMDMDGAQELSFLIKETDALLRGFNAKEPFLKQIFAAHSECDSTANISGIEDLQKVAKPDQFTFFRIPEDVGVSHASLVLKDSIYKANTSGEREVLEFANPKFQEMLTAIAGVA